MTLVECPIELLNVIDKIANNIRTLYTDDSKRPCIVMPNTWYIPFLTNASSRIWKVYVNLDKFNAFILSPNYNSHHIHEQCDLKSTIQCIIDGLQLLMANEMDVPSIPLILSTNFNDNTNATIHITDAIDETISEIDSDDT